MTDNMKGLLDELQGFDDWVGYQQLVKRLRTAVEGVVNKLSAANGRADFNDTRAIEAERGRDELKRRIPSLKTQLDDLAHECEELKRRLEEAHARHCLCGHIKFAHQDDDRCLALRKGK